MYYYNTPFGDMTICDGFMYGFACVLYHTYLVLHQRMDMPELYSILMASKFHIKIFSNCNIIATHGITSTFTSEGISHSSIVLLTSMA